MRLLERYITAVHGRLPRATRDDIAAELHESLQSQIEAERAERRRHLTDHEIVAILKRFGPPQAVAARYGARDHLIGPRVYSLYIRVVKMLLWILGTLVAAGSVIAALTAEAPVVAVARAMWVGTLVTVANLTLVTLIFMRIEGVKDVDWSEAWDGEPEKLTNALEAALGDPPGRRASIPRFEAISSIAMAAVALLWWSDVMPINRWLLWSRLSLEPAQFDYLTPLVVTLSAAAIAASAAALAWPSRVRIHERVQLFIDAGTLVLFGVALVAPAYVVATGPGTTADGLARLLTASVRTALLVFAVVVIVDMALLLRRRGGHSGYPNGEWAGS